MLKFIICGFILGILCRILLNVLKNLNNNIEKAINEKSKQKRYKEIEEFRKQQDEEDKKFREKIKEGRISYRDLYKGANTLKGNCYNFTAEVVQKLAENIYHVNMTEKYIPYSYQSYYVDCIQISLIGTPSEILMKGDYISFTGEVLGYYTCIDVFGYNVTVPWLKVYAESLKVIGWNDKR